MAEHPEIAAAGLPSLDDLVIGGHDLAAEPLAKRAERLAAGGVVPAGILPAIAGELDDVGRPAQMRELAEQPARFNQALFDFLERRVGACREA